MPAAAGFRGEALGLWGSEGAHPRKNVTTSSSPRERYNYCSSPTGIFRAKDPALERGGTRVSRANSSSVPEASISGEQKWGFSKRGREDRELFEASAPKRRETVKNSIVWPSDHCGAKPSRTYVWKATPAELPE